MEVEFGGENMKLQENDLRNDNEQGDAERVVNERKGSKSRRLQTSKGNNDGKRMEAKRFPHSTRRRNKRRPDQALLQTPEEELDLPNTPFRDLILLAEHRDRVASKEAEAAKMSSSSASVRLREDGSYFNYQSYMDKTPFGRWTKHDTELFYQAVRQFGSDISMIQQLFPSRSHKQVKLKYKKEERLHPLTLTDALRSRLKDHSHFEQVIEQLRRTAAASSSSSSKDDVSTDCPTDINSSHSVHADEVNDAVQNPGAFEDSDDDLLRWNEYTSDL